LGCKRLKHSIPLGITGFRMVHRRVRGGKYKINYAGRPCPVEVGDELEVNITDVCPSGDGMSKIQGFVITVPKAKPRERVKVKITQVGQKAAVGEIIQ
jgi:predicted RNA-binding protein with TRAM domain